VLYFEDIEPGKKSAFGRYEVTREEVVEFASKYDPQPFHLSDEAAATTYFGRLSASGWHTAAMMMSMLVKNMSNIQQAGLGSPGLDELRWLKPVYPGDVLRVETEILDKTPSRSKPDMGSFRSRATVFNQDNVAVMTVVSIGLIRRRLGNEEMPEG
jgi:acyl dehydratase